MPISMKRWEGKVAVVTGASAGIGAAIAKDLVNEGLQVVALARRKNRLDDLAATLRNSKGKLHPYVCDLSSEESILSAFAFAKTIGPIHILINNAGKANKNSLYDGDTQKWRDILEVNVLGLCIATREAVRDMRKNGVDGHIVHINSVVGHKVPTPFHMYPPSKYAVTALTETLRLELNGLGSKVKVTSVSPGYVKTEFIEVAEINQTPEIAKLIEAAQALEPEDVSDAVLYTLGTPPHVQVHELIIKPIGEKV